MVFHIVDIKSIKYEVDNEITRNLPTEFKGVCLEMSSRVPSTYELNDKVEKFIISNTGWSSKQFVIYNDK